jgi:chromosome segregation ATPase
MMPAMAKSKKLTDLQKQEAEAESQLQQLKGMIHAGRDQLAGIQEEIKAAEETQRQSIVKRQRELETELKQIRDKRAAAISAMEDELILARQKNMTVAEIKDKLEIEIADLNATLLQLQNQHAATVEKKMGALNELRAKITATEESLQTKKTELGSVDHKLEEASKKLAHIEQRIVEGEQAYSDRSEELRQSIVDAEQRLQQNESAIQSYEASMAEIRATDEARTKDLEDREQSLHAQQRALMRDQQDFAGEKRRFAQTRAL